MCVFRRHSPPASTRTECHGCAASARSPLPSFRQDPVGDLDGKEGGIASPVSALKKPVGREERKKKKKKRKEKKKKKEKEKEKKKEKKKKKKEKEKRKNKNKIK